MMSNPSEKSYYDEEYSFIEVLRRLWTYARTEKIRLFSVLLLYLVNIIVSITVPLILRVAIDELTSSQPNFANTQFMSSLYLIGVIITWIIMYMVIRAQWAIIAKTVTTLRMDMFIRLQEHDLSFYDKNKTGKIQSRVVNDAWELGNFLLIFVDLTANLMAIFGMVAIMISINVWLTLGLLIIAPIIFITMVILSYFIMRYSRICRRTVASVNGAMQESIAGISISKSFAREARNKSEFIELNEENLRANVKRSMTFATFFPIFDFIAYLIIFIIIYQGGSYVISGDISQGELWLFYSYANYLVGPLIGFSQQITQFQSGRAAAERIFSLIELPSEMKTNITSKMAFAKDDIKGKIEFRNLTFGYTDTLLYDNLSVTIPAGQNVALVGHTGSGKTSFVSLLARFYEYKSGTILIDDNNVRDLDLDSYRNSLGIVLQDPYLFSGTIRDNILYGCPVCEDEDETEKLVKQVTTSTHVKDFVEFLPEGINTEVGERGSLLSLGQRQLISYARALAVNPKILILDEATASVDAYTESLIQDGIEELFKNRTSIVVAHRLSTVIGSDRILVFDHGKIVGDGSHDELIENNETYRNLYKTYYEFQGII